MGACVVEGCERMAAHAYCEAHLQRLRRGMSVDAPIKPLRRPPGFIICGIPECSREAKKGQLCRYHAIERRRADPGRPMCLADGCGRRAISIGYCPAHAKRVRNGSPIDGPIKERYTIDKFRRIAAERGGKCLTETYVVGDWNKTATWECSFGHIWNSSFISVAGVRSWCPICSSGRGERICRSLMERMFDAEFPKIRPSWLRIGPKSNLELDGYNNALSIAFEYQGSQHYKAKPGKLFTQDHVDKVRERDAIKADLCARHCVKLIIVREFKDHRDREKVLTALEYAVIEAGVPIPDGWAGRKPTKIDPSWAANTAVRQEIHDAATHHGGRCLSSIYVNARTNLTWECRKGHIWNVCWASIRQGTWCPTCAVARQKLSIDDAKQAASSRNGECLSEVYENSQADMMWMCGAGHEWVASLSTIRQGHWCRKCSGYPGRRARTIKKTCAQ